MPERDPHEAFSDGPDVDIERIIRIAVQAVRAGVTYHEAPRSDQWTKWMLGACGALVVVAISSGVSMYGKLAAIEANQITQAQQQARMQNQIDGLIAELRK